MDPPPRPTGAGGGGHRPHDEPYGLDELVAQQKRQNRILLALVAVVALAAGGHRFLAPSPSPASPPSSLPAAVDSRAR
ncbi:MAG: hypothetical protein D6731_10455 [Planctomycetota bacterium]|nr:MAG: hypothetical protein D6731_10455 [Planctomycetota bacterium]